MSLEVKLIPALSLRFPRVSGDEPINDAATDFIRWFSPRERG